MERNSKCPLHLLSDMHTPFKNLIDYNFYCHKGKYKLKNVNLKRHYICCSLVDPGPYISERSDFQQASCSKLEVGRGPIEFKTWPNIASHKRCHRLIANKKDDPCF